MNSTSILAVAILATVVLVMWLVARPGLTAGRPGKVLAFLVFFLFPAGLLWAGVSLHIHHAKSTDFCLSCHEMEPYGRSMRVDDAEFVAAKHFQNHLVPEASACFTCHTDYTMFGDVKAKLRGLRHVYVHYLGEVPEEIALYEPYNNRECLHCHAGARSFVESWAHEDDLAALVANQTSCLESGCHDVIHDVAELEGIDLWAPSAAAEPGAAGGEEEE